MKGVFLFILAVVLTVIFTCVMMPWSIVYHLVTFKILGGLKKIDKYFHQMALSIDQFANVSLQSVLNLVMIKPVKRNTFIGKRKRVKKSEDPTSGNHWVYEYYDKYDFFAFGDEDDTMSYVFAKNYYSGSLNNFGLFWAKLLNILDKDHLKKSIENKKRRDIEAFNRLKERYSQLHNIHILH